VPLAHSRKAMTKPTDKLVASSSTHNCMQGSGGMAGQVRDQGP
jgi:hypothetical protein